MRKNIYLIKIFVLLHAPFGQRMQFVKEIRRSIDDKLDTGMTIDEVIEELGEASALTEEYNDAAADKGVCMDGALDSGWNLSWRFANN